MTLNKKLASLFASATLAFGATAAMADYPNKPVKIVVGFSAGGSTDVTARGIASFMNTAPSMNGQPAYIVNLPGASGQKAAKSVLDTEADGYTLYMINIGTFIAGELSKGDDRPYHVPEAFDNLGCAGQLVTSLQVHASDPAQNMQEFIANAKASGKEITWSTSGAATMHATIGHIFFDEAGIKHKKVPFKGGSKARAALVSQSVDATFGGVNTTAGFEDDIRVLATAGAERDAQSPDVPTFAEEGIDKMQFTGLMCLFAKKGTPQEVKDDVSAAVEHVANEKAFKKYLGKNFLSAFHTTPADAAKAQDTMYEIMGPVVANIIKNQ